MIVIFNFDVLKFQFHFNVTIHTHRPSMTSPLNKERNEHWFLCGDKLALMRPIACPMTGVFMQKCYVTHLTSSSVQCISRDGCSLKARDNRTRVHARRARARLWSSRRASLASTAGREIRFFWRFLRALLRHDRIARHTESPHYTRRFCTVIISVALHHFERK